VIELDPAARLGHLELLPLPAWNSLRSRMAGKWIECWEGASRARRSSGFAVIEDCVKSPGARLRHHPK
jgi:hypothetical protein